MKLRQLVLATAVAAAGLSSALVPSVATAQAKEQFFPLLVYRTGAYAPNGTPWANGKQDYIKMINARDGGINGVKLTFEECETGYATDKGVECYERLKGKTNTLFDPQATGITFALTDKVPNDKIPLITLGYGLSASQDGGVFKWNFPLMGSYWTAADILIQHIGKKEGGMDKLKGKKIVHLYHDSAYGKEPLPVLEAEAAKWGFELIKIPITPPGSEQQSQWLQIRQANPDYVIMWTFGVMSAVGLKTAQRNGFPREKILGVWWAGSEEDTEPAGEAAKGFSTMSFTTPGEFPILDEIRTKLYKNGQGNLKELDRVGNVMYMRGIAAAVMMVESMRNAQNKFGKGKTPADPKTLPYAAQLAALVVDSLNSPL